MATTKGPLMSMGAAGTIGGSLVFGTWKGRNTVRELVRPANPKSAGQVGLRAMFAFLSKEWDALYSNEKAAWAALASGSQQSGFNVFLSLNQKRWQNFLPPSVLPTFTATGAPSDRVLSAAAWEHNRIKLTSSSTGGNERWGFVIFAKLGSQVSPGPANAIIVFNDVPLGQVHTYWSPPTLGRWYFNSHAFSDDGKLQVGGLDVDTGA